MRRSRARHHALRAAAAAAFTFSAAGCGADPSALAGYDDDAGHRQAGYAAVPDDAGEAGADDAGALVADGDATADAGVMGDGGPCTAEDWERSFWKCCEANGWVSPDESDPWGCTPWGPPAPPAFRQGVA